MSWKYVVAVTACCAVFACRVAAPPAATPSQAAPVLPVSSADTITEFNNRMVSQILRQIAGRETQPAESVFTNVIHLGKSPARTLLVIIER